MALVDGRVVHESHDSVAVRIRRGSRRPAASTLQLDTTTVTNATIQRGELVVDERQHHRACDVAADHAARRDHAQSSVRAARVHHPNGGDERDALRTRLAAVVLLVRDRQLARARTPVSALRAASIRVRLIHRDDTVDHVG